MPVFYYRTELGRIGIGEKDSALSVVILNASESDSSEVAETPLIREAHRQITAYLAGTLTHFDLPLNPEGTMFMQSVWRELRTVPYGHTCSYGDIAHRIGKPGASRAVGMACGKNPIPIIIPCHRVIGASGSLTGFSSGIELKRRLLGIEGVLLPFFN